MTMLQESWSLKAVVTAPSHRLHDGSASTISDTIDRFGSDDIDAKGVDAGHGSGVV